MNTQPTIIRIRGKDTKVLSTTIAERPIVVTGKWIKVAAVKDEDFVVGETVVDPRLFICQLQQWNAQPHIFAFSQKFTDPKPKFQYYTEWEDFAVIPITTYKDWLQNRIKKDVKENLRRAKREGVVVRTSEYDDKFVQGVKDLCDETPVRQGKRFWHHGKSFDAIKEIHGTYRERAEYIGAYFGDELIGFIKMVYVGNYAKTMNVISKEKYQHVRPTNALLAKAVEVCEQKGMTFFIYGQYNFPGKKSNSLTEFKHRNGFEEMKYPRYYVPLNAFGELALRAGLHKEVRRFIPIPINDFLLKTRAYFYRNFHATQPRLTEETGSN